MSIGISAIIPTYNGVKLFQKNLDAVLSILVRGDELIVVDDASTDETSTYLSALLDLEPLVKSTQFESKIGYKKGIRIIVVGLKKNQRFARACNIGFAHATNDILLLLNNDVVPKKDLRDHVEKHFQDPAVFGVGCREIARHQNNESFGKAVGEFQHGLYVHARAAEQTTGETAWVAGGSGFFRRSHMLQLSGFDTAYYPAYGEDIDLSFRARQKGWKTLFDADAVVYHDHETTNASVFGQKKIAVMSYKNALLFMWKVAPMRERVKHFLWLPYHLIWTTYRSRGAFLSGFFWAVRTAFLNI